MPIVRTFMPVLAGVSKMDYRKFVTFDIVGAILWGGGVTVLGYFLGNVAFIRDHIEPIFLLIVLISILPGIIAVAKKVLNRGVDEAAQHDAALTASTNEPTH